MRAFHSRIRLLPIIPPSLYRISRWKIFQTIVLNFLLMDAIIITSLQFLQNICRIFIRFQYPQRFYDNLYRNLCYYKLLLRVCSTLPELVQLVINCYQIVNLEPGRLTCPQLDSNTHQFPINILQTREPMPGKSPHNNHKLSRQKRKIPSDFSTTLLSSPNKNQKSCARRIPAIKQFHLSRWSFFEHLPPPPSPRQRKS